MFTSGLTESSQSEVRIVGVESESMHLVLDYAYTSRVTLSESNVQALFTAASIFQIPALQDQCAQFMISRLDPQNCIGVYMFADAYGHQELRERSQDYIRKKVGTTSSVSHFYEVKVEAAGVYSLKVVDLSLDINRFFLSSNSAFPFAAFSFCGSFCVCHPNKSFSRCARSSLLAF